ncbi:GNAT family N-acetyltransferase [Croceicoccus sp. YJ47]|uniref:GNAT family N-acetyltransferase n=1 Tax=Croceicoccus sp. YJ47 TaxID=2798724 RepID=UPI0019243186|nr:GNAT family N-acetyltransferase [Croceicoccus sp. YJ47]QQN73038.1 N-acetyltransferase [Croceicoccus sp. YJ47]
MAKTTITHHAAADGGEYHAAVEGADAIGRLTYKMRGADVRVADHTLVPPAIGGQGVAAQLVEALIADAKEEGFRIVPQCSYVEAAFRKHPEWSDLRA